MVSVFYFTPLPGFFSPFPHGTCSLSVTKEYLALRDGPRGFQQNYTCSVVLRILQRDYFISFTGLSPSIVQLSIWFNYKVIFLLLYRSPTTPSPKTRFRLVPFRSPLLRKSSFLSFPPATKMFQFTGLLSLLLWIHNRITINYYCWVPPFGNLRIKAYLPLPEAYRCSSRPSSAFSAKAFTMRPY
jgi:hypothetical protein